MILKGIVPSFVVAALLAASSAVMAADSYQPGDFLRLDLNQAALSPVPLGPPARFEKPPIEAAAPPQPSEVAAPAAQAAVPPPGAPSNPVASVETPKPHASTSRPRPRITKPRLARRHGNPLDAQARDTRIQVWPCRTGGICNWKNSGR